MVPQAELVRVRIAPSPTGPLHMGLVRTALFNWLFARQHNGRFVLRIEDTDKERSEKRFETEILEGFSWLGLDWDEGPEVKSSEYKGLYGPYRQSERIEVYKKYIQKLLKEKRAYYCYCTKEEFEAERQAMLAQGLPPKYSGHCRDLTLPPAGKSPQVIRFRVPETIVAFKDIIRGKVQFDANLFGDIVIAKSEEEPLYNFAAVVDDFEMNISHVIRGEDHISNTPKQILLQKALNFREVAYAHLPLILNPDRSKLSKRYTETSLLEYRSRGYLPEAIVNFLALLGWHSEGDNEVFALSDLIKKFDLKRVQKGGAVFNQEKLDWLNREHLKNLSSEEIASALLLFFKARGIETPEGLLRKIVSAERTRIKTLQQFLDASGFFFALPAYEPALLIWQKETAAKVKFILAEGLDAVEKTEAEEWNRAILANALGELVEKEGRGPVFWPLRVAVSGLSASPDPLEIMEIIGPTETKRRIRLAIQKLDSLTET